VNDHVSLYLIRNQSLNRTKLFGGIEEIRNASYLRNEEAIIGTALHLGRARPYPDPRAGYTIDAMVENSGHFLGATQQFTRTLLDYRFFEPVTVQSKLGVRLKYGWGSVNDKNLFELGGIDGLRGFDRKTVRGANALMGSVEYRFPLLDHLDLNVLDHLLGFKKLSGVAFFDAGQSWYDSFGNTSLRKDAGLGLRLHMTIGSFLEQTVLRVDAAKAINDDEDDIHYWFGVNQAF
jgi:outer membrane protein assembly factor BamA